MLQIRTLVFPIPLFRRLALATAVASYGLIVLGGAVKAYGAGLACPDWPLCYGEIVPAFDYKVALEWGHRVGALVVSLLCGLAAFVGWRAFPAGRRLIGLGLGLLGVQVLLGGVTVLWKNAAFATASHLAVATLFLAVWLGLARGLTAVTVSAAPATAWVVLILGSYLKSAGGGLACPSWPLCGGPLDHWLVGLHWAHRLGALGLCILVLARRRPAPLLLYLTQAALGGAAVLLRLSPAVVALHLAVGVGLFAALTPAAGRIRWPAAR